jgi:hypothetical protein
MNNDKLGTDQALGGATAMPGSQSIKVSVYVAYDIQ